MTRPARMGATSIDEIYKWSILDIVFDWTLLNESGRLTFWRFGISI